jgi:hypothetical protein
MNINYEKLAKLLIERLEAEGYLNNCLTCANWNEQAEICRKFKERPPLKVIVTGCEYHELIPF